jgi:hypothetical protein
MSMPRNILVFIVLTGLLGNASVISAQSSSKHNARTDRLVGLNKLDLDLLDVPLQAGPIALVEFAEDDQNELPAVNLATYIDAPAAQVAELIADPLQYPSFMSTIDKIKLVAREGQSTVYDWGWTLAVFQVGGRNAMTVFPPSAKRPGVGYRITIDTSGGDLGTGRFSIRVLNKGTRRSLLVFSVRLDLRRSNYVLSQMAKASRSVNRSANLALACTMMLSIKREAERRAGLKEPAAKVHSLDKPPLDLKKLAPLLIRGDLVFFDMDGQRLNQLTVLGRINYGASVVRGVMTDADSFSAALVPGSEVLITAREPGGVDFNWNIALPLIGTSGSMRLRDDGDLISVDATSGALRGGRWRFQVSSPAPSAAVVVGWGSFDLKNSTWWLQNLVADDPFLEHGLAAAADIMLVRSVRARAKKVTEDKASATP